jgi:hypothetical protein
MTHLRIMNQASHSIVFSSSLEVLDANPTCLPHEQFLLANQTPSMGFLISIPRALALLMVHKIRDDRFQALLVKTARTLLALLFAAFCGFKLMPILLAVCVSSLVVGLFAVLLWLEAGDILLEFALEDERFFELATGCRALTIVEDPELSLPQPTEFSPHPAGQI